MADFNITVITDTTPVGRNIETFDLSAALREAAELLDSVGETAQKALAVQVSRIG